MDLVFYSRFEGSDPVECPFVLYSPSGTVMCSAIRFSGVARRSRNLAPQMLTINVNVPMADAINGWLHTQSLHNFSCAGIGRGGATYHLRASLDHTRSLLQIQRTWQSTSKNAFNSFSKLYSLCTLHAPGTMPFSALGPGGMMAGRSAPSRSTTRNVLAPGAIMFAKNDNSLLVITCIESQKSVV